MIFTVYVLINPDSILYIGHTDNINRRLFEHNNGLTGYTSSRNGPWELVYSEDGYASRGEAMRREKFFKTGKGREFIKSKLEK